MTEAQMQTFFRNYMQNSPPKETEVYEFKIVKGNSLPFSQVKDHQLEALLKAERKGFYYKIPDQPVFYGSRRRFITQKPFDAFYIDECKSYVVVWFYKPRETKIFIKIRVGNFLRMRLEAKRKSFTEEMALKYGFRFYVS